MPLPFRVYEGGVGHSVGSDGARWNAGQTRTRGATRAFTRDLNRRIPAGGGLVRERRGIQDGIGEAPVNQRKGRSGGQRAELERGRHVAAERERIVPPSRLRCRAVAFLAS